MKCRFLIIALVGFLIGCGPRYGGCSFGGYGNLDRKTTTSVAAQRDPRGRLLFVIAWINQRGGGSSESSGNNLLTRIHGHAVRPKLDRRAVYAFQTDGSLVEIPLSEAQITTLFGQMEVDGFHPSHNQIWQQEIAPKLVTVEAKAE